MSKPHHGNEWSTDNYYTGGYIYLINNLINNTDDNKLYQSERFGNNLVYTLPNLNNIKNYKIILHFVEIYFVSSGKRVFNIYLNNELKINNFDIFAEVGQNTAIVNNAKI